MNDEWINACMNEWMNEWINKWMNEWMNEFILIIMGVFLASASSSSSNSQRPRESESKITSLSSFAALIHYTGKLFTLLRAEVLWSISQYFLQIFKFFLLNQTFFFFFQHHPFQAFLVSKAHIFILIKTLA